MQLFLLMARQVQAKPSQCLDRIGMTILAEYKVKTRWWAPASRMTIRSWVISRCTALFRGQLSIFSWAFNKFKTKTQARAILSFAASCKYTMKSCMTFFRIVTQARHSTSVRTNTQESLLKDSLSMLLATLATASTYWEEANKTESQGRQETIFILQGLILSSKC